MPVTPVPDVNTDRASDPTDGFPFAPYDSTRDVPVTAPETPYRPGSVRYDE